MNNADTTKPKIGRPPRMVARKPVTMRVEPDVKDMFDSLCVESGESQVAYFSRMIKAEHARLYDN